jgi:uncharacterized membrane protein YvlD (DUF360 family)
MLPDAIIGILRAAIRLVLSVFPTINWPVWFETSGPGSLPDRMKQWGSNLLVIDGWFPITEFFDAMNVFWVAVLAAVAIKVVRIILSLVTGGGGSAA